MKKFLCCALAVLLLALVGCDNGGQIVEKVDTSENNEIQGNVSSDSFPDLINDGIIETLMGFGFTETEASDIRELFLDCGLTSLKNCKSKNTGASIDDLVAFVVELDKDRTFMFTVEHREVFYIAFNGVDIYDKDDGGILANIQDIHIPESEVSLSVASNLRDLTEQVLDKYFTNAKYYDAFGYARQDDDYMVQCQVYAANALNMKDWVYAKVWFRVKNDNFEVIGVQIDGKQYEVK